MHARSCVRGACVVVVLLSWSRPVMAQPRPVRFDSGTISGLPARNIGSATMSGRIAAVTAASDRGRLIVYAGAASGGVWKSVNGGTTFRPVFDRQNVQSIGAISIDPGNPNVVWVGTGESWTRNSVSIGDGVYKSVDGGENWTNVGLQDSERIAKIVVDPRNGDHVLVCATGHLWDDRGERGVYRTTDGGTTWRKVLAGANASTGCGMLASAPAAPDTVYAAMWDFRRAGWTFRSGGPGSGLFKSTDGGATWAEIAPSSANGLPGGPYGRLALAVAPSKPSVVYAMIESSQSALYRSDDAGATWKKLDASQYMVWRPFYFAHLVVDPTNENRVFKPGAILLVSTDGGRSFSSSSGGMFGDTHDVWIDPANPRTVLAGDDAGMWFSKDGGSRWEKTWNLPISQFYHVSVDGADPYRVYGGLQDTGSWVGDSSYPGGVSNSRWENVWSFDGFWTFEDPADPRYVYAEAQGGEIVRVHRVTHEFRLIKPYPGYGEPALRFNWNTPIHLSPNEKGTIYIGAQYLFRSRDQGRSWERLSPDLTTNDPEKQKQEESGGVTIDNSVAEAHTTIYSIAESPANARIIWVGTDDGNVQITRDGGASWTNVGGRIPGVGTAPWVSWVEASRHDEATAYVAIDRHTYGDMSPYLFRTRDYGQSWTALPVGASGVRGYAHVVREDPENPSLLFLGTELGLWVSIDGGERWVRYTGSSFPAVAVRDIVVHPRTSDVVLATHGRGIWIIDDISPLRALTPDVLTEDASFLPATPAVQYVQAWGGSAEGDGTFVGQNRPGSARIYYYQRTRHIFGDLKIEVFDGQGTLVGTVPTSRRRGLNRATWSMRLRPPRVPPAASLVGSAQYGPRVLPGTYTVRMTRGDEVYTTELHVVLDPRAGYTMEDRRAQFDLMTRVGGLLDRMSQAVDVIVSVRDAAADRASTLPAGDPLRRRLEGASETMDALRRKIVATREGGALTGEERLRERLASLYGDVNGYEGRPTDSQIARADSLGRELEDVVDELDAFTGRHVGELNEQLSSKQLPPIAVTPRADRQKTFRP